MPRDIARLDIVAYSVSINVPERTRLKENIYDIEGVLPIPVFGVEIELLIFSMRDKID